MLLGGGSRMVAAEGSPTWHLVLNPPFLLNMQKKAWGFWGSQQLSREHRGGGFSEQSHCSVGVPPEALVTFKEVVGGRRNWGG